MTLEDLKKLEFKFFSHITIMDRHVIRYKNEKYGIMIVKRKEKKADGSLGRVITRFIYKDNLYTNINSLLAALNKDQL